MKHQTGVCFTKRVKKFAKHVEKATELVATMIYKKDIPIWLSSEHQLLENKSPIQIMWEEGEKGFKKITKLLECAASGSFQ